MAGRRQAECGDEQGKGQGGVLHVGETPDLNGNLRSFYIMQV